MNTIVESKHRIQCLPFRLPPTPHGKHAYFPVPLRGGRCSHHGLSRLTPPPHLQERADIVISAVFAGYQTMMGSEGHVQGGVGTRGWGETDRHAAMCLVAHPSLNGVSLSQATTVIRTQTQHVPAAECKRPSLMGLQVGSGTEGLPAAAPPMPWPPAPSLPPSNHRQLTADAAAHHADVHRRGAPHEGVDGSAQARVGARPYQPPCCRIVAEREAVVGRGAEQLGHAPAADGQPFQVVQREGGDGTAAREAGVQYGPAGQQQGQEQGEEDWRGSSVGLARGVGHGRIAGWMAGRWPCNQRHSRYIQTKQQCRLTLQRRRKGRCGRRCTDEP